jgi:iron complex transport system ATP-binding protein
MILDVKIKNIEAEVKNNILVIWSKTPLKILSSAILNGGLREANGIINVQVPEGTGSDKSDVHWSPEDFLNKETKRLQLPEKKVVGLMTAAKMKNIAVFSEKCGKTVLIVLATAGSTVAVTAGEPTASKKGGKIERIGTINIILLVDGNLTEGCMVEAIKTLTEAKTVALRELDIRSQFSGDLATGTLTDSVVVGCTKKGDPIQYAGTFTLLGELIAKCVRKAVKEAMFKQENLAPNRTLIERLAERGISSELIMSLADEPIKKIQSSEELKRQVELILSDQKIVPLLIAALRLDDDLEKGLIPKDQMNNINNAAFEEIVMATLKCSLNGEKNLFDYVEKERNSENRLGPSTKCLLTAILKKACSNIN